MNKVKSKILIIGKNSYIGTNVKLWLEKSGHLVDELDAHNENWDQVNFGEFDSVIQVAAIVHRKDVDNWDLYKKINVDLPVKVATCAKKQGVHQFVFLSTMAVYGKDKNLPNSSVIDSNTQKYPTSLYGKSKNIAEEKLKELESKDFRVAIVRPPNVYGPNCKGNYIANFKKLTTKINIFPEIFLNSRQSMLYIDNLSELIRLIIEKNIGGYFMPQDDEIVNTCELINYISHVLNKKIFFSELMGKLIFPFARCTVVNKVYGGVYYHRELSTSSVGEYNIVSFQEGIRRTIGDAEV